MRHLYTLLYLPTSDGSTESINLIPQESLDYITHPKASRNTNLNSDHPIEDCQKMENRYQSQSYESRNLKRCIGVGMNIFKLMNFLNIT